MFDQMYKLYINRLVDKDTFKAMTGYDVKEMPKPKKVVKKTTTTVIKLGNKPAKVGAGYELHHEYDPKTNTVTYYAVKKETAVQHREKDISLFENGRIKSDQQLYADLNYDGYATADAAGKQKILETNKRDFERQFGEGYYNLYNDFYTNMSASGQYFTDAQKAQFQGLIANPEDYANSHSGGWDSFSLAYSTAWNNANVNVSAGKTGKVDWSMIQKRYPGLAEQFQYGDSAADEDNKRLDVPPESFTKENLIKAIGELGMDIVRSPIKGLDAAKKIGEVKPYLGEMSEDELIAVWAYIGADKESVTNSKDELYAEGKKLVDRAKAQNNKINFLGNASVDEIDRRIASENAKKEPDEPMLSTLKLYRYYKNDLGIPVTGDYETDRSAAKKVLEAKLYDLTGIDGIKDVASFEHAVNANATGLGGSSGVELTEGEKQAYELLKKAPPELYASTKEERDEILKSTMGASIGGLRKGLTLGLAELKGGSVADPEELKRLAMEGNSVGGTEYFENGRFYFPSIAEEDAAFQKNNPGTFGLNYLLGSTASMLGLGGLAGTAAQALGVGNPIALNAISGAVPSAIRGGADAAANGGDAWDILAGGLIEGTIGAASFGGAMGAAEKAMGTLLAKAPGLIKAVAPAVAAVAGSTVGALANTGLNIVGDLIRGRDIDWNQVFTNMGVDFALGLFLRGKNGDTYIDPATGKSIEVPEGKTLKSIDPEAAAYYKSLGDTKVTGELHNSIGDVYTNYLNIPENVVSRAEFKPLETAYRNYEANNNVTNAATFLDEAAKVYKIAGVNGYVENPYNRVNAAIEVGAKVRQGVASASGGGGAPRGNGGPVARFNGDDYSPIRPLDDSIVKVDGEGKVEYNGGQRATEGVGDYIGLVEKAKNVDVSTSAHQAIFYSGEGNRARAEAFAKLNEKTTLEMTPGGKYFDELKLFEASSPLTKAQAREIWRILSKRYAQGASGNVYGFVNGSYSGSIFNTVEYPALQRNPYITNIFTELFK